MDYEREIHALEAEALATQIFLANWLRALVRADPKIAATITEAFNEAANVAEHTAIQLGKVASADHTVKALGIIEEMRTVVLGNKDKPKHGV